MPLEDVERGMQDEIVIAPVATNQQGRGLGRILLRSSLGSGIRIRLWRKRWCAI